MNQILIGRFIAQKRKELGMTQAQLAAKVGVSNKAVSKWECGKCLPDYSSIKPLCKELNITVAELLDGEENEQESIRVYDEEHILEMVERVQHLETHNRLIYGILLIVMGIAFFAVSRLIGGSNDIEDFISGVFAGLSVGVCIIGTVVTVKTWACDM